MKIIALVPVKNESWALPSYISSVSKIADQIIALNDSSSDESKNILLAAGVTVVDYDSSEETIVNMGKRRQKLLEIGRKAGGTHFIWLDADEAFSANFIPKAFNLIRSLAPGQKITMRWVHAWKNTSEYLIDNKSPFGVIWKDFIVCDKKNYNFESTFLSEARTQGPFNDYIKLPDSEGVVLHWQFARWEISQLKQAHYRCTELIKGERSTRRINNTYRITLPKENLNTKEIPNEWTKSIITPADLISGKDFYINEIMRLFNEKGINFFEGLEIWHIKELYEIFIKLNKREPKTEVFPLWLIRLNELRHAFK